MSTHPTILITGASGYIGKHLIANLKDSSCKVRTLTTNALTANQQNIFYWNPEKGLIDEQCLLGVDYIINLAGANIGTGRWTKKRRAQIINSRVKSTELLYDKVLNLNIALKAYIGASAIGYYGTNKLGTQFDENSPAGNDFLAQVCVAWENQSILFADAGYRTVIIRTGMALSPEAPALKKMLQPIKLGIGGPIASGKQFIPWISIVDLCNIYLRAINDESFAGIYNAVSPSTLTNYQLTKALAAKHGKPYFFPATPAWLLRILLGEMSTLISEGNPVYPRRLLEANYSFVHQDIGEVI